MQTYTVCVCVCIDVVDTLTVDPALLLIVVGSVMFLITFLGCFGALRNTICLLKMVCQCAGFYLVLTLAVCSNQLLFVLQFVGLLVAILLLQIAAAFVGYFFTDTVTRRREIVLNRSSKQTNVTVLLFFRWWRELRGSWWRQLNDTGRTKTWRTPLTSSRRRWRRVLRVSNLFCSFFFTVVMTVLLLHCDCSSSAVELKAIKTGPVTPTLSVRTPTRVWRPVEFPSPAAFACRTRSEPVSEPVLDVFGMPQVYQGCSILYLSRNTDTCV